MMSALLSAKDFDSIAEGSAIRVARSDPGLMKLLQKAAAKPTVEPIPNLLQMLAREQWEQCEQCATHDARRNAVTTARIRLFARFHLLQAVT